VTSDIVYVNRFRYKLQLFTMKVKEYFNNIYNNIFGLSILTIIFKID